MSRLEGKIAVISGVCGGIGSAALRRFVEEGAQVIGTDIDAERGEKLEKHLTAAGPAFQFSAADVSVAADVEAFADYVRRAVAGVDVLFNNAGVIVGKPLMETSEEDWDRVHAINAKSAFLMTKAFVPLMAGRKASIVNVSSIAGVVAFANTTAYGAAKASVAMLSKAAAVDLAPDIRVNAICPGVIDTPMPRNFVKNFPDKEAIWRSFEEGHLCGRVGQPEEVVSLALYLASDEASFMTGAALPIDGGWSTQ